MRIYVATKFENAVRAQEIAKQLEQAGHTITYPWWLNDQINVEQASLDFWGVCAADAFVLLVDGDYRYSGALTEFGIALGRGIPVYLVGHALDVLPEKGSSPNIFTLLPRVYRGIETLLKPIPLPALD